MRSSVLIGKNRTGKFGIEQQTTSIKAAKVPGRIVPAAATCKQSLVGDINYPKLREPMTLEMELSILPSVDKLKVTDGGVMKNNSQTPGTLGNTSMLAKAL